MKIVRIPALLLGLFAATVSAQTDSLIPFNKAYKRVYPMVKVSNVRPVIDGQLNDSCWTASEGWSDDFVQIIPYERVPSNSPTKVKLFYDHRYLYIGVWCKEAYPDRINRFIGNRDDNSLGDLISVAFDPYHDFRAAPEFNINAGGNQTDLVVTDTRAVNLSWNAVWEGRTYVSEKDSMWSAELRIPFSQLRYNHHKPDGIWGLHVRRVIRRNNEVQNWSMIPLKNNGHVFSFGEAHGMTDLPKPRGIEFLPYALGKYISEPRIAGSPYQTGNRWAGNVGLDAKVALRDYTMDITINPDFGQVELDPSVMNLTAYETFYDEKRPFFLEGKHIFDFTKGNDMMFYSRRIGSAPRLQPEGIDNLSSFAQTADPVPILGAVKLTGTNRHGLTLGVMQSFTARTTLKTLRNGEEGVEVVEPFTNYTVARVQKNHKGNTLLGLLLTSVNRSLDQPYTEQQLVRNAFTGGIDFTQYFKNRLYYIDAKAMISSLDGSKEAIALLQQSPVHYYQRTGAQSYLRVDPTRTALYGTGGYLKVGRKGNSKWIWSETFNWLTPGFDLNEVGYLKEADNMNNETELGYRNTDIWKKLRYNALLLTQKNQWNYGGHHIGSDIALQWQMMTLSRMELILKETYAFRRLDSRLLRGGQDVRLDPSFQTSVKFNTDKARRLVLTLGYEGEHGTTGERSMNTLSPAIAWRVGNHLHLSGQFDYGWNDNTLQYVATVPTSQGKVESFVGHLKQNTYGFTLKAQFNVTPDLSIQFYGSPFTSAGRFDTFKQAETSDSDDRTKRFYTYSPQQTQLEGNQYTLTRSETKSYRFSNPDFSFNEFRSNFVVRWEYLRGSTLYFVWQHRMSNRDSHYTSGWGDNLDRLFNLPSTNTFMIKMNYWFCL